MTDRRAFLYGTTCVLGMATLVAGGMLPTTVAGQTPPTLRIVSRERMLQEAAVARKLYAEEQRMTELLQAQVDEAKLALASEEAELAEARAELSKEDFDLRIKDFDTRMRRARLITQERSAILKKGFQDARAEVVAAIPAIIELLRQESGATIILNADQALAAAPELDLTDRAIQLFDLRGPKGRVPQIDLTLPVTELVTPATRVESDAGQ